MAVCLTMALHTNIFEFIPLCFHVCIVAMPTSPLNRTLDATTLPALLIPLQGVESPRSDGYAALYIFEPKDLGLRVCVFKLTLVLTVHISLILPEPQADTARCTCLEV